MSTLAPAWTVTVSVAKGTAHKSFNSDSAPHRTSPRVTPSKKLSLLAVKLNTLGSEALGAELHEPSTALNHGLRKVLSNNNDQMIYVCVWKVHQRLFEKFTEVCASSLSPNSSRFDAAT